MTATIGRGLREIAKASAANFALPLSAVATAPFVARALGSQGRGEFAALTSPVVLVGVLGTLGFQDLATQLLATRGLTVADVGKLLRRCASVLAIWNVVLAAIFAFVAVQGGSEVRFVVLFFLFAMPAAVATSLIHGLAVGRGMFAVVNLNRMLTAALRVIAIGGAFLLGVLMLETALIIFAAVQVVVFLAMYRAFRKGLARRETIDVCSDADVPSTRQALASAVALLAGAGFAVSLARLDQSLALPIVGAAQLGFYAVAVAIFEIPTAIIGAIRMYIMGASDFTAPSRRAVLGVIASSMGTGLVVALVGYAGVGWAIPLVFGEDFRGAVGPTRVLLFGLPFAFGLATCAAVFVRQRRNAAQACCYALALTVNGGLLVLLGPPFGAIGLSAASACAFGIGLLVASFFVTARPARSVRPVGGLRAP